MQLEELILQRLHMQGLPVYEMDIPYIMSTLATINQAQLALKAFPNLNQEIPITIVDQGVFFK